jgi:hypothetical protein
MNREFLGMVMETLADLSHRLDMLKGEMVTGEAEPVPMAKPHPAGPNVVYFPTRHMPAR